MSASQSCAADSRQAFRIRPEDLERREADHLEHVGGRGLLLQRFAEFGCASLVEQPRVLDGDHRLVGEGRHQLDLLVGERADLRRQRRSRR